MNQRPTVAEDAAGTGRSPIDQMPTPATLDAHVMDVDKMQELRIHGYAVETDLVRHYTFQEIALLAWTGEPPNETQSSYFDVAMSFISAIDVTHASVHAASLARRYGSRPAGVASVASLGLAEHARDDIARLSPLLGWLTTDRSTPPPVCARAEDRDERERVDRMRAALGDRGVSPTVIHADLGAVPSAIACLWESGLHEIWQLETVLLWSRLPFALAESFALRPGTLPDYPINLPRFDFEGHE